MELHKNLVKEKRTIKDSVQDHSKAVPKDRTEETAIFTTTERGSTMYRSGSRWCEDSSNLNGGWPMYFLLDKHRSISEKTRETNKLSTRTSKTTISLDNALGEKSCVSSHSINNFLEERPSEGKEDCVWSNIGRPPGNQTKDVEFLTRFRLKEPAHVSTGRECELLYLLKDKYQFHDETNKNILYDYEIERFAELYCITNFFLVLSCCDSIFWLKDPDGVIYMWSRIDGMMIRGGCDMKEALINFLFREENLCYIEEYTLKLIPVKKAKEEAKKWYEENKHKTIKIAVTDELLKPLEEKTKGSNKGGNKRSDKEEKININCFRLLK